MMFIDQESPIIQQAFEQTVHMVINYGMKLHFLLTAFDPFSVDPVLRGSTSIN